MLELTTHLEGGKHTRRVLDMSPSHMLFLENLTLLLEPTQYLKNQRNSLCSGLISTLRVGDRWDQAGTGEGGRYLRICGGSCNGRRTWFNEEAVFQSKSGRFKNSDMAQVVDHRWSIFPSLWNAAFFLQWTTENYHQRWLYTKEIFNFNIIPSHRFMSEEISTWT